MKKVLFVFYILFIHLLTLSSQTVGVLKHSADVYPSYTLLAPNSANQVYLIDPCGRVAHSWDTRVRPALKTTLTPQGNLLRTSRVVGDFQGGGTGGEILMFDWEGNELWHFIYANESVQLHHDIDYLPNGNVIAIAWEALSESEAVELGRDPSKVNSRGIWPDHVIEYNPGLDSIVWSWHVKDHLIQDFDPEKVNYGVVEDHPELIDFNLIGTVNGDWNHLNSIDYNPELDQIILSSRTMNEIWIIDHSTSREEAAGHTGGNSGRGGDLLYRWGNPRNYRRGLVSDQKLFGQHDARWIKDYAPDRAKIMIYNNGSNRPGGNYSSIEIIDPPIDNNGSYNIEVDLAFLPQEAFTFVSGDNEDHMFFSDRISGADQLPNGNVIVCEGIKGRFLEFNPEGELIWIYANPLDGPNPVEQGQVPFSSAVFKLEKYPIDFPAFDGKNLEPGDPLEINPTIDDCLLLLDTKEQNLANIEVYPNPTNGIIYIESNSNRYMLNVFNALGRKVLQKELSIGTNELNLSMLNPGFYFIGQKGSLTKIILINN